MVRLQDILKDESGATAVEYGLILAMIVLAMLAALSGVAQETLGLWDHVESETTTAVGSN